MSSTDIVGYSFQADIYCPTCTVEVMTGEASANDAEKTLDYLADQVSLNRYDEQSFDSWDFPKVIFADQVEDTDRCAGCNEEV